MKTYPITLTVNGRVYNPEVPAGRTLLELLRGGLHLNAAKYGCGIGECGACTIIMNGRAVNSCLVQAAEADGAIIETAEGEKDGDVLSDLQQAFIDHGAIQCGFCTSGMLNSARALLRHTPDPSYDEIVEALAGNYCRCTGYDPFIKAIQAVVAGRKAGGYKAKVVTGPYVGGETNRIDGVEKVAGSAVFVHDMVLQGMLYARMLTSPHGAARIRSIDTTKAAALPGVRAVLTGKDLTQKMGLYMQDKDILAREIIRYHGEAVDAVAAESWEQAEAAIRAIVVDYEVIDPIKDVDEALAAGARLLHPDMGTYSYYKPAFSPQPGTNVAHHQKIRKGDVDKAFETSDLVFEHTFRNPPVQHVPMETHTAIVHARPGGEVDIITSAQSPFTVRQLFCHTFSMPLNKVRVRVPYVGGGFGGKAGIALEPIVYCLSKAAGCLPVKLTATREEEFNTLPCRQGLKSIIKTGVNKDGKLQALKCTYLWDAGAYADYGVNVGRAAAYSGAGPYMLPNCWIDSKVVYTNKVFGTAYRGFGHLEVMWGIERNMDLIAHELGIDPLEFRKKNLLKPGDHTITGELFTEDTGRPADCLDAVAKEIGWTGAKKPKTKVKAHSGKIRAKAVAMLHKAPAMPSFTSCGCVIHMFGDGSVAVHISGVDYGQGTYTSLAQIAADELSIPIEKVKVPWECDTDFTPYDWQTVASRFAVMGGSATIDAARDAIRQMKELAAQIFRCRPEKVVCKDSKIWVEGYPQRSLNYSDVALGYVFPDGNAIGGPIIGRGKYIAQGLTNLDKETGQGTPALNWTYGAHAVDIELDTDTGAITVVKIASAFDVGQVLNLQQCRAQVIGGVVQGIGSALVEKFVFKDGRMQNNSFVDYKIPTALDIPLEAKQIFLETPHPKGPYGARGVGEHPMISIPSVIGNAIAHGTGVDLFELPMDPERVYLALKRS
jgi:CO/xanthine dehydrogenase Mo-binding subunit/aerobic-type carbon monoxide dehydrogenase small subunit (CoxS/CutS family)